MKVTYLGTSASFPAAGGACAGLLVESGTTRVLLDCGTGVMAALQKVIEPAELDAILISHFHPDHFLDLVPLRYGLRYGLRPAQRRIPLWVQTNGKEYLTGIGMAMRGNTTMFADAYDIQEYTEADCIAIGDLQVSFCRTTHDIPTFAMRVTDSERTLVYGADTRESDDLAQFAQGADLLVLEATYPASIGSEHTINHLTAHQAGELARKANPGALTLTHFWPGIDPTLFLQEAEASFGRPVELAQSGRIHHV